MQSEADVEQQLKADLQRRLFDMKVYMALMATLHNTDFIFEDDTKSDIRRMLKKNTDFNTLNNTTLNLIIDLNSLIPSTVTMNTSNFESKEAIANWLEDLPPTVLQNLNANLMPLEKKQKISKRWDKVTDAFYVAAQAVTPLTHIPILQVVAIPIVSGLWGGWYASWAISIGYDPALGGKIEPIKSTLNKASYLSGGIATVAAIAGLIPPFLLLPICGPIAAIGLLTSNVLWAAGTMIDFYKEIKDGKRDGGRNWRIAGQGSTVLYTVGSIVIAALAVTALFTPVGWAVGAGAVAFGIGAATASLAVFGVSKFCQWRANVAEKREKAASTQTPDLSSELSVQLTELHKVKPLAKQATEARVDATTQAAATPHSLHLFSLKKKQDTATSVPTSTSSTPLIPDATTQPPPDSSQHPKSE